MERQTITEGDESPAHGPIIDRPSDLQHLLGSGTQPEIQAL